APGRKPRARGPCPHLSEKMGGVKRPRTPQAAIPPGLPAADAVSAGKKSDTPRAVHPPRRGSPGPGPAHRYPQDAPAPRKSPSIALYVTHPLRSGFGPFNAMQGNAPPGAALGKGDRMRIATEARPQPGGRTHADVGR